LLAGKYNDEVNRGLDPTLQQRPGVFSAALIKA